MVSLASDFTRASSCAWPSEGEWLTSPIILHYTQDMGAGRFHMFGQDWGPVAAPTSVADAQAIVREHQNCAILPWGGGTRRETGYVPARADLVLSTENLTAVTDYEPADMTVTVQAGVTIAALQNTLAEHGQWLPLDVAHAETQTIGGIIATRAHSLSRFSNGSVRDHLLGVGVVNGRGEYIKGGGKVVKNVAGYDLPKLYCGSWGTLGLITDASFKVAPRPEATATVALSLPAGVNSEETLDKILSSGLAPAFLHLLNTQAARSILQTGGDDQVLVIGFDGNARDVQWQCETLGAGDAVLAPDAAKSVRTRLRDFSLGPAPLICAFHILSSQVGAYSRMMEWVAQRAQFTASVASDAAMGIVHAHFAPNGDTSDWRSLFADVQDKAARVGGSFVVETMPQTLREMEAPVWSPLLADFALTVRLKNKLDPHKMWNPGRFAGLL